MAAPNSGRGPGRRPDAGRQPATLPGVVHAGPYVVVYGGTGRPLRVQLRETLAPAVATAPGELLAIVSEVVALVPERDAWHMVAGFGGRVYRSDTCTVPTAHLFASEAEALDVFPAGEGARLIIMIPPEDAPGAEDDELDIARLVAWMVLEGDGRRRGVPPTPGRAELLARAVLRRWS